MEALSLLAKFRRGVAGLKACVWKDRKVICDDLGACLSVLTMANGRRRMNAISEVPNMS